MTVAAILKHKGSDIVSVGPDETIEATAGLMTTQRIGSVMVLAESGAVLGLLSERDIVRGIAQFGAGAMVKPVRLLMTERVVSCSLDDTTGEVMARMTDRRIRHLPVMDGSRLVGIISIGDVVKRRIDEALLEADELRRYIATG